MGNYIERANLNIYNGTLAGSMEFQPELNLISGENGTLKTRVLFALKGGAAIPAFPNQPLKMQAISPKRNSERRAADSIIQIFRQQNRTLDAVFNERLGAQINDTTFENYPSLGDLYYLVFEKRTRDGGDRRQHMVAITEEFNSVIRAIFEHYTLVSTWNEATGAPSIRINKTGATQFPIEALSLGEQEILSLAATLYTARDHIDVFLIDEPEVHLNWHLEDRLFTFLDDLCDTNHKQAIVVTHSRIIFKPRFISRVQFLYWNDIARVAWGRQLTPEQHRRLAGEAIEIIRLGEFSRPTFFVEDHDHVRFLEALANVLGVGISITQCGNSSNVRSLFQHAMREGGWQNSYFLVDGDNECSQFPGEAAFIHLPVYCSDNILIRPDIIGAAFGKTELEARRLILDAIKTKRAEILKKNRFFDFLVDSLTEDHITYDRLTKLDASVILDHVAMSLSLTKVQYTERYLAQANADGMLDSLIPAELYVAMTQFTPSRRA